METAKSESRPFFLLSHDKISWMLFNLILFSCFILSGASSLIYEIVWLKKLVLVFGSTTFSISCILSSFMLGLGTGSLLIGRVIDRFDFSKSVLLLIYVVLELAIGAYGLSMPSFINYFVSIESLLIGSFYESYYLCNILIFIMILFLLLIPTMLMGATFPVMCKMLIEKKESKGSYISFLYFINTFGGVLGVALSGFYLLPFKGVTYTNNIAIAVNFSIALIAISLLLIFEQSVFLKSAKRRVPESLERPQSLCGKKEDERYNYLIYTAIFSIGVVSMSLEIALTKYLSLFLGPDTYVFCIMLITFLLGITIGSILINLLITRIADTLLTFGIFQLLIGLFCFAGVLFYKIIPWLYVVYFRETVEYSLKSVLIKLSLCSVAMLVPAILIGALFPLALNYRTRSLSKLGTSVGKVYLSNTFGSVIGSFVCAFVMIPFLGIQNTIYVTICINIVVGLLCVVKSPNFKISALLRPVTVRYGKVDLQRALTIRFFPATILVLISLLCIVSFLFIPKWDRGVIVSGTYVYADRAFYGKGQSSPPSFAEFSRKYRDKKKHIIFYKEGINSVVSVSKKPGGNISMRVNGKVDAGTGGDMRDQILIAQIPMMIASSMNEKLDKALCIGFGSGVSLNVMSVYNVNSIRVVELEAAVLEAGQYFEEVNDNVLNKENVIATVNDGRNHLLLTEERYDVILSEPSNPFISGAAKLFTKEYYQMAEKKLSDNGIYAQWIPLYGFDEVSLKGVLKSFIAAFPNSLLFNYSSGNVVVMGFKKKPVIDVGKIKELFYQEEIRKFFLHKEVDLKEFHEFFALFKMGGGNIRDFVRDAVENTDDNSLVEYLAPISLNYSNRKALQRLMKKHSSTIVPYLTNIGNSKEKSELFFNLSNTLRNSAINSELSEKYLALVSGDIHKAYSRKSDYAVNDMVRLKKGITKPLNGWGCLKHRNQHGKISRIVNDHEVLVSFGDCIDLLFEKREIERILP